MPDTEEYLTDTKEDLPDIECKILIVEDSDLNAALLNKQLQKHSAYCDRATTGKEAIKKILNSFYDVVLMDVNLRAEISGLEAVRFLREHGFNKYIIAITAAEHARKEAMESGCDDFMVKPWTKHDLVNKINIYLLKKIARRIR